MPARLPIDWDAAGLGSEPDRAIAARLRCAPRTVAYQREKRGIPAWTEAPSRDPRRRRPAGIDWDTQPLGEVTDREIAESLGVTDSAVQAARGRRGIRATALVDWDAQPLGRMSDRAIARALGLAPASVREARIRRGIPPWSE